MKRKQVRKVYLIKDILVLMVVFIVGIACLLLGSGWSVIGVFVLSCGLSMVPFYMHGYKIKGQKGLFLMEEIPVSRQDEEIIRSFINGENSMLNIRLQQNGGALLLLYRRKTDGLVFVQYYDYNQVLQGKESPLIKLSAEQDNILRKITIS